MAVPEELLAIMACLECGGTLRDGDDHLECTSCGLRYPVEEGVPVMLVEEAYRPEEESP